MSGYPSNKSNEPRNDGRDVIPELSGKTPEQSEGIYKIHSSEELAKVRTEAKKFCGTVIEEKYLVKVRFRDVHANRQFDDKAGFEKA